MYPEASMKTPPAVVDNGGADGIFPGVDGGTMSGPMPVSPPEDDNLTDVVHPVAPDVCTANVSVNSGKLPARNLHKMDCRDAIEEDGSLRFFWLDYTEVNDSLYLFGKVKQKSTAQYESAIVKVENILRKLYFLPRDHRVRNGFATEEKVDMHNVREEVDALMSKQNVPIRKTKAFDLQGKTFSRVFGTNTALFEQFVMWKNVMGPCWLKIKDADFTAVSNTSYCKLECAVSEPKSITLLSDTEDLEPPQLTLMSLAFRKQTNANDKKQEMTALSCSLLYAAEYTL
ncbi:hypothetical protein DV735_g5568, partial [Chaetothyriales sp. CBS 134920]